MCSVAGVLAGLPACGPAGSLHGGAANDRRDLYGDDDRREASDPANDPFMVEASRSVAMMVDWENLQVQGDGYRLASQPLADQYGLCPEERFRQQPAADGCTAFLVAPNVVATAAHCTRGPDTCSLRAFVFGYAYEVAANEDEDVTLIEFDGVFGCSRVLVSLAVGQYANWPVIEYALVLLDRPVPDRAPLKLQRARQIPEGTEVTLISHTLGLPTKIGTGAVLHSSHPAHFDSALDAYGGASGAPVLGSQSRLVEGVYVAGSYDWEWHEDRGCATSHHCTDVSDPDCPGHRSTRAFILRDMMDLLQITGS
jgi:V8-like Glu-specific endopeptidase